MWRVRKKIKSLKFGFPVCFALTEVFYWKDQSRYFYDCFHEMGAKETNRLDRGGWLHILSEPLSDTLARRLRYAEMFEKKVIETKKYKEW